MASIGYYKKGETTPRIVEVIYKEKEIVISGIADWVEKIVLLP